MNTSRCLIAFWAPVVLAGQLWTQAAGLGQRVANSTLQMPQSPPVYGFQTTNTFGNPPSTPGTAPVALATPPGETNRLFLVDKAGGVFVCTNLDGSRPAWNFFLDLADRIASKGIGVGARDERGLLGMAFHPGYATNRYFFLFYSTLSTTPGVATNALHERVSRFQTMADDPNQADASSEVILIDQYDQDDTHNGGDLHFGPDGYLYVSLGDEGCCNDIHNNSQRIDKDFFSAILRLDVDKRPTSLPANPHPSNTNNPSGAINYAIPPDNPFVGVTDFNEQPVDPANVRTEFYAVGFRNPWRFSIDPVTGLIYCGDVGESSVEEIDIVRKGGNYGWAYLEGSAEGPKYRQKPRSVSLIAPIQEYSHLPGKNSGYCVTGGIVYHGKQFPQLAGAYVFADYASGNIWTLRYDGPSTFPFEWIANDNTISAFGLDPRNDELLMTDHVDGTIKRLMYTTTVAGTPLPATLADTGAFSDLTSLTPSPGIVAYDINVPFWSDNAQKTRWFSVPNTNLTLGFNPEGNWSFPTGTVWIKHFDLELTNGLPESRRRLETRFIVRKAFGIYGVTYRWDSATNATLVADEGMDEPIAIRDGGTVRTQIWHYPSRAECLSCHTASGGLALGFNTPQMNCEVDYGSGPENQIAALSRVGYFSSPVTNANTLRALAHPSNTAYSVAYRVHSYLAANCVQCHPSSGPAFGFWNARISKPLSQAGIINGLLNNNRGDTNNRVIAPGSLEHSMMLTRTATRGSGQMPPLDSTVPDTNALNLLSSWITNDLPRFQSFADWQIAHFGSTNAPDAAPDADPDNDGANNLLEYLTGTDAMTGGDAWGMKVRQSGNAVEISYPQIANRGFQVEWALSLSSPALWQPLVAPGNHPSYPPTNFTATISDTINDTPFKYYRVRAFEP